MNEDFLTSEKLTSLWSVSPRRVRQLLSKLETLGFTLQADMYGARRCHVVLAQAVRAAREAGTSLDLLASQPELERFRSPFVPDVLDALIKAQSDLFILRAVVGELWRVVEGSSSASRISWSWLGLPDPRLGL